MNRPVQTIRKCRIANVNAVRFAKRHGSTKTCCKTFRGVLERVSMTASVNLESCCNTTMRMPGEKPRRLVNSWARKRFDSWRTSSDRSKNLSSHSRLKIGRSATRRLPQVRKYGNFRQHSIEPASSQRQEREVASRSDGKEATETNPLQRGGNVRGTARAIKSRFQKFQTLHA